jgi:hypothetical protein
VKVVAVLGGMMAVFLQQQPAVRMLLRSYAAISSTLACFLVGHAAYGAVHMWPAYGPYRVSDVFLGGREW